MKSEERQILSEIRSMMASLRKQMDFLEEKMAQFDELTDSSEDAPIELSINYEQIASFVPVSAPETAEPKTVVVVPVAELEPVAEVEPEVIAAPEAAPEPEIEDLPVAEDEPETDEPEVVVVPVAEDEPEIVEVEPIAEVKAAPVVNVAPETEPEVRIIDKMQEKQAWRTAMPGTPVKDVRCGIALVDRAFFINRLFSEDPMLFQQTLNDVNRMSSLDEAVSYFADKFPGWDFNSDAVYRFMMAVRRKLN